MTLNKYDYIMNSPINTFSINKIMDKEFFKPKYWGVWILIIIIRVLVFLPYKFQIRIALFIGFLAKPFVKRRYRITLINLKIAFPNMPDKEIKKLARKSYYSAAVAAIESCIAWFMPTKRFNKIFFSTENMSIFENTHNNSNNAVIVLGFHFHCLEIIGRYIGENYKPFTVMYQKHKNPLIEYLITSRRERYVSKCFQRKNIVSVIKSLKKNISMWYAPDQDFGHEHTIFAPFFDKPCSTLTVTPWLAIKTKATVIPAYYVRNNNYNGYKIIVGQPLEFKGDDYEDAKIKNEFLENAIKKYPEQYLWQHRRYKTRPKGECKIY